MELLTQILEQIKFHTIKFSTLIIGIIVLSLIYWLINYKFLGHMINKSKTKREKSHIYTIKGYIRYFYILIVISIIIVSLSGGSLAGFGLSAGFLTAALGWALQRPITGVAAWIMVIFKRPFSIGDRIVIGTVKGEVKDISPTHITLKEVGGTIESEEISGRIITIPNAVLFEQNVINYTSQDDFVLDQITTQITYESNLDKALKVCINSAKKITEPYAQYVKVEPHTVIVFAPSGIDIKTRYMVSAFERSKIYTEMAQEIFKQIKKAKDLEIAYPHTEIVYHGQKK